MTPQRWSGGSFQSGPPPPHTTNDRYRNRSSECWAGPDLRRAPSQYSIECNDKNENQSELEAEHQWKAGGVRGRRSRRRRSAPSSDARRQRACTCGVVKGHFTEMNSPPSATNTVVFQ